MTVTLCMFHVSSPHPSLQVSDPHRGSVLLVYVFFVAYLVPQRSERHVPQLLGRPDAPRANLFRPCLNKNFTGVTACLSVRFVQKLLHRPKGINDGAAQSPTQHDLPSSSRFGLPSLPNRGAPSTNDEHFDGLQHFISSLITRPFFRLFHLTAGDTRVTQKNGPRVHFMCFLLYLFTDCPYFTGHGRINDCEYTKTPLGAETKNTLC